MRSAIRGGIAARPTTTVSREVGWGVGGVETEEAAEAAEMQEGLAEEETSEERKPSAVEAKQTKHRQTKQPWANKQKHKQNINETKK